MRSSKEGTPRTDEGSRADCYEAGIKECAVEVDVYTFTKSRGMSRGRNGMA